ncbi:GNAT family N-acetyltransferase [Granulosicoccus antarcticus]|uniref:Putative N-acetyltransferase YsnE n=1 Tax=Granulosicoccus antarcticus IMCC3135 TaxID=1192854 RepID=A0A2Z2NKW1_9GAMM|nr:GNAT family N-acetyltransferase [Granulosicoccus antarcticus]ASJ72052.1 putative N-acetyltransferase YsnE [Granulosicoccus antarcticus IMCC3135]
MKIQEEDPGTDDVHALLLEHLADMHSHSPPESTHALDMVALRNPDITFWSVRDEGVLQGCGALKQLDAESAEIKSMKTAPAHLRKGVAQLLLSHMLEVAKTRGLKYLLLETGTPEAFTPARQLYARHGFVECEPFADYKLDPYSVFMRCDVAAV